MAFCDAVSEKHENALEGTSTPEKVALLVLIYLYPFRGLENAEGLPPYPTTAG